MLPTDEKYANLLDEVTQAMLKIQCDYYQKIKDEPDSVFADFIEYSTALLVGKVCWNAARCIAIEHPDKPFDKVKFVQDYFDYIGEKGQGFIKQLQASFAEEDVAH